MRAPEAGFTCLLDFLVVFDADLREASEFQVAFSLQVIRKRLVAEGNDAVLGHFFRML
jgi:hypothetical protein